MIRPLPVLAAAAMSALLLAPLTGCSEETKDKATDTVEAAKDDAAAGLDDAQARTTAEALRAGLKANDTADKEGMRSIAAINEVIEDLPGDPDITGADDGDGDGLDDDGRVQANADESQACVALPAEGEDAEVTDGAC